MATVFEGVVVVVSWERKGKTDVDEEMAAFRSLGGASKSVCGGKAAAPASRAAWRCPRDGHSGIWIAPATGEWIEQLAPLWGFALFGLR